MATTPNRGYQLPAPGSKLKDDVLRLIAALGAIDTDVANLLLALPGKSDLGHGHAMAEITGLVAALGNKLDVGYHDALANLTDVDVAGVASGMALLRQASKWIPVALQINNIAGLETALNGKATPADITAAINALVAAAPGTLDTLNELATALGNDPNFATTITTALAGKQPLDSDLTAIAALTTTAFGRALLTVADAGALRAAASQAWEQIGNPVSITSAVSEVVWTNLSPYRLLRLAFTGVRPSAAERLLVRESTDNGATWISTTSFLHIQRYGQNTTGYVGSFSDSAYRATLGAMATGSGDEASGDMLFTEFNQSTRRGKVLSRSYYSDGTANKLEGSMGAENTNAPYASNALRLFFSGGTINTGFFVLEGLRG